jgi:diaminopropionate ammonia-lyase
MAGCFAALDGPTRPKTAIVEPDAAACFYRSALAGDGHPHSVAGDLATIMAGLACGEPNPVAWSLLRDGADVFFSCPDAVAAAGMRLLGNPLGGDPRVTSGESGAVTAGLLMALLREEELGEARAALALDEKAHVLLVSTEGDTDPESYRRILGGDARSRHA